MLSRGNSKIVLEEGFQEFRRVYMNSSLVFAGYIINVKCAFVFFTACNYFNSL